MNIINSLKKPGLRFTEPMSLPDIELLHTGALLARLNDLRSLEEGFEGSIWSDEEYEALFGKIVFKDTEIWKSAWDDVKSLLANREHIERGDKERRRQAAKAKQHR